MPKLDIFFPEGIKVKVAGQEFVIKPFVLRTRAQVLRIIADVCLAIAKKFPAMDKNNFGPEMLPQLIEIAGDKLIDLYIIALGKDKEWLLDNVQLKDEVGILEAIIKVNDIPFLYSQVKQLVKATKAQTRT